jgi:hypothetical protein
MTDLPEPKAFGDYAKWPGRAVHDSSGTRLGEVREIYLDESTDRPEWVLIDLRDAGPRFVPLVDATVNDDGLRVAQATERIKDAPELEPSKELTQEEERRLYSHYGLSYSEDESDSLLPVTDETPADDASPGGGQVVAPASARRRRRRPTERPDSAATGSPTPPPSASGAGRPRLRRYVGDVPELPSPGDTSEPEDTGPMVPPRPEPVAPAPSSPPPPPQPESSGPLAVVRDKPALVAGLAASLGHARLHRPAPPQVGGGRAQPRARVLRRERRAREPPLRRIA